MNANFNRYSSKCDSNSIRTSKKARLLLTKIKSQFVSADSLLCALNNERADF